MKRSYQYVGPEEFCASVDRACGTTIQSADDLIQWLSDAYDFKLLDRVYLTYVIVEGDLLIADRSMEYVACAGRSRVEAAGELAVEVESGELRIVEVTNQSTGYCPEPECWDAIEKSFNRIGVEYPDGLTLECIFRRCDACKSTNIVKDQWFYCAVCDAALPRHWNF